jgi:hypothetical protein
MPEREMGLAEAEGWLDYWETVGLSSDPAALDERAAARAIRAELARLRALAGEAEPTGDTPHIERCGILADHETHGWKLIADQGRAVGRGKQDRWCDGGAAPRSAVPAGGSAPADEPDGDHASVPRVHLKWWAETLRALASHAIQAKNAQDTALETAARISFWAQERLADEQAQMTRDALTAPHQGATTDVTALLAELDRIAADPHRAWLYADQIRALLGAGETTEADQ